jgi:Phosphotransferase enzyme family
MSGLIRPAAGGPHLPARQRRDRAVRAAVTVARRSGFDVRDPYVLADANNTIVHLRPAALVAKVATSWMRDGSATLAHELALAVHVARRGGPIPRPAGGIPAEVHHHDGLAMTFWRYVERSGTRPSPATTTGSLRRLHAALDGYPGMLPPFDALLDELAAALHRPTRTPTLAPGDRSFLREVGGALLAEVHRHRTPARALHGDPHEGNRITTDGDVLWVDLEAACIGPLEWDLSSLDDEDASLFDEADPGLLGLMRDLRSWCVATLCWLQPGRAPEVDEAAVWHLDHLKER